MKLCRDAEIINRFVNDKDIRPHVGPMEFGELDFGPFVDRPENLFPIGEYGGFALIWSAPHTLEVHTFILPEGRGAWARKAARDGIDIARQSGAERLWTRIPPDSPNVRMYARIMGMRPTGEVIETFDKPYEILGMELKPCQQQR